VTDGGRRIAASIVLLAIALVVVPTAPSVGAATLPRISVYGDSVLLGASDQIVARLAPMDVTVDAHESNSLLGAIDGFRARAASMGDVVVLDLGYNDMADSTVFRQRIDLAMSALAPVPRVIWLNQRVFADGRAAMNDELVAAAARYANLDVVDWDAVVRADTGLVYPDGIHLTPAGRVAMAELVRQRVDAYVASQQPQVPTSAPAAPASPNAPASAPTESVAHARPAPRTTHDSGGRDLLLFIAIAVVVITLAIAVARRSTPPTETGFTQVSSPPAPSTGPRTRGCA